jgi:hypothetical protein
MQSIEYRYMHDPLIKALVDSLEHHIHALQLTPSEIRECAMLAAIRYEQRRPPQGIMVQNGHIRPTTQGQHAELESRKTETNSGSIK